MSPSPIQRVKLHQLFLPCRPGPTAEPSDRHFRLQLSLSLGGRLNPRFLPHRGRGLESANHEKIHCKYNRKIKRTAGERSTGRRKTGRGEKTLRVHVPSPTMSLSPLCGSDVDEFSVCRSPTCKSDVFSVTSRIWLSLVPTNILLYKERKSNGISCICICVCICVCICICMCISPKNGLCSSIYCGTNSPDVWFTMALKILICVITRTCSCSPFMFIIWQVALKAEA